MSRRTQILRTTFIFISGVGHAAQAMPELRAFELSRPAAVTSPPSACPVTVSVGGIDVSNFNPGTDWPTVARTGRGFAVVKATEGLTMVNKQFARDWAGIKAAGLVRGAYHFFLPDRDPVAQAQSFLSTVGTLRAGDLAPILDWENPTGRTAAEQIAAAIQWLNVVEAATKRVPIIYVSPAYVNALGNPPQFARYPLFLAHYGVSCPRPPAPWTGWTFWQYAMTGAVAGVPGDHVDQDLFNGTAADLARFAR